MNQRGVVDDPATVRKRARVPADNLLSSIYSVVKFEHRLVIIFIDGDIRLVAFFKMGHAKSVSDLISWSEAAQTETGKKSLTSMKPSRDTPSMVPMDLADLSSRREKLLRMANTAVACSRTYGFLSSRLNASCKKNTVRYCIEIRAPTRPETVTSTTTTD